MITGKYIFQFCSIGVEIQKKDLIKVTIDVNDKQSYAIITLEEASVLAESLVAVITQIDKRKESADKYASEQDAEEIEDDRQ